MARPRKTYTAEFKLQAVKMVTDQKLSVAEAARRLGVGENLLRDVEEGVPRSRRRRLPGARPTCPRPTTNSGACGPRSPACEAERDLLKKAAAYFASPPT